ncbi:MAG: SBBP repeat-containing protein [Bryobacteraceae bacterium]|nr:SBBP repeat-containing protein [Bryobacterales bacterium]NUN01727.1 SBBP repeat-containing protein [Bryobacteraceae bacterium]
MSTLIANLPVLLLIAFSQAATAQLTSWSTQSQAAVGPRNQAIAQRIASDHLGNTYVAANLLQDVTFPSAFSNAPELRYDVALIKLDPTGKEVFRVELRGSGNDNVAGLAVDIAGNAYLTGFTDSTDFPVFRPYQREHRGESGSAFVAKISTAGSAEYVTLLGGSRGDAGSAIAAGPDGSSYVTGWTSSTDFPVTEGAFQKEGPPYDPFATFSPRTYAFAAKFSPDGSRLVYSTYLGGDMARCSGGSNCIGIVGGAAGLAIAADAAGNAYVAGNTNATNFPVTPGALQTMCRCIRRVGDVFVSKLNPTGTALVYSTYLGGDAVGFEPFPGGDESLVSIAPDPRGMVAVTGITRAATFPTTMDALKLRTDYRGDMRPPPADGFLSLLSADGASLLYSTLIGGGAGESIAAVRRGPAGTYFISGTTYSRDFPRTTGFERGSDFLIEFDPLERRVLRAQRWPTGATGGDMAANGQGAVLLAGGDSGVLTRLLPGDSNQPQILGIASAAGSRTAAAVSPGELVSLYGVALGPGEPRLLELFEGWRVTTELGGAQVLFDGIPAPLLYAQRDQINTVVPFEMAGRESVSIQVRTATAGMTPAFQVTIAEATPELFRDPPDTTNTGFFSALNQDGTLNSFRNAAARGTIIALFGTGAGRLEPTPENGVLAAEPLSRAALPVRVLMNGQPREILYAGAAPTLVAGMLQVNARVPEGLSAASGVQPVHVQLLAGHHRAERGYIVVGP